METIDLTPSWAGVMPVLLACLEDGTEEGKKIARKELTRLASLMDSMNERGRTLRGLIDTANKLDKRLDDPRGDGSGDDAQPPTGDDYNELRSIVGMIAAALA